MVILDVFYTAVATILVMALLQVVTFFVTRMLYPPEAKIIYREAPPQQFIHPLPVQQAPPPPPAFTQPPVEEVKLPEYEPRQQVSDGLRLDAQLPTGLQAISTRESK